jgi:hypothetical protein
MRLHLQFFLRFGRTPICVTRAETNFGTSAEENWGGGRVCPNLVPRVSPSVLWGILVPRALLTRGATRGLAKSITGYHKNMVRKQYPVLELANQMPVRNMVWPEPLVAPRVRRALGTRPGCGWSGRVPIGHVPPRF